MSFEAYSVAVRLSLIDNVASGLIGLASHFNTLNRHVAGTQAGLTAIEGQLNRIKMLGLAGGAAFAVGVGGLALLEAPIKAAREYELAFTKFKTLNLGDAVNAQADKFARSANIMGVSAKQLMNTMSESVGIFGSFQEAQKYVPQIAALNVANSAIFHGKIGAIDEGGTRALMKFIDRRGGTRDQASFDRNLNLAERVVTGSGGFIQFRDLAQFSQQGGVAFRGLSDQGLTNMALLLQEQGGARAGTAMMSIYQNLVAGRTPVKTMHMLEDFGLGHIRQQTNGTLGGRSSTGNTFALNGAYAAMLQADPATFFRDIFLPKLAAHGITSESGILKATNDLLSNRTAAGQASIMTTQLLQIARDASLTKNAQGANAVIGQYAQDPNARWANLQAKYQNLMVELGEAALPLVTKAVTGLTWVVTKLTSFAHNFPGTTKALITAFTLLAGASIAGGAIALTTAGIKALGLALTLGGGAGGLGASLMSVAGALGVVGKAAAAFGGGYAIGSYLNDKFSLDEKIGGYFDRLFHSEYDPNKPSNFVRGHINRGGGATSHVYMDGQKVGSIVTKHQSKALNSPQTGISDFDSRQSPMPAGGTGSW